MAIQLWANGQSIFTITGGEVVLEELDQFSSVASVRIPIGAIDDAGLSQAERAILAMQPFTLVEVVQDGVGTIAFGRVLNPAEQITDRDEHTITLELAHITSELVERRTRRGWRAKNTLDVIFARLATLVAGWQSSFLDLTGTDPQTGQPLNFVAQVTLDNPTVLAGILETAKTFGQHVRMAANPDGTTTAAAGGPLRRVEVGQFGLTPTVYLQDAKGGDPEAIAMNTLVRLIATLERQPADVTSLQTVVTPFGGGKDTDSLVTLELLWRILNDPGYRNYGRYGSDAQSQARTGQLSVFPEYDPGYPISDPEHPPDGVTHYLMPDGSDQRAGQPNSDAQLRALGGVLAQGAIGTRIFTMDGHSDYTVFDPAAYAQYGYKEPADVTDSSLNYTSSNLDDQELTARALYVSAITYLKRFAHPHHMVTCTVANATARPTRAGDLITIDYQHGAGALAGMSVVDTLVCMKVVRSFPDDGSPPSDTYTLSNQGRFDQDDAAQAATDRGTIVALQRQQGTGLAKDSVVIRDNIDFLNPITYYLYISPEHFRYHQVRVRCDWFPFRGTANTAYSDPNIPITLREDVSVPHGDHNLAGAGVHPNGAALTGTSSGFTMNADNGKLHMANTAAGHANTNVVAYFEPSDQSWRLAAPGASTGGSVDIKVTLNLTPTQTADTTTAAVNKAVAVASTLTGKLPAHNHLIEQRIPTGQPSPVSISVTVNGVPISSGAAVQGSRDPSGAFTSSFIIDDIASYLDSIPHDTAGVDVPIIFRAGTSPSNLAGVGYIVVTITAIEELGGLASTFVAS